MVVGGFYSGLRMGDLILLRIGEIDFRENVLRLVAGKTNRRMIIPLAPPFRALLASITEAIPVNNPNRHLWPAQAVRYETIGGNPASLNRETIRRYLGSGLVRKSENDQFPPPSRVLPQSLRPSH